MPARLRAVPDHPPRALGLVRVSKVGDRGDDLTSPELQRAAITDHCRRRGYEITGWIEGIDESGSNRKSRWWAKLDQAVSEVEAGNVDVLVTWRFSRAGRQRLRWAVAIDRVEVAGGLLESATEPLDTSTASGRLARGMLSEFAAYESEQIGAGWRETQARRVRAGLPANGKPRFGYRASGGMHRPDTTEGPILAELYRRYVAGESFLALTVWLNDEGIRTVPGYGPGGTGGVWTQTTLRRVLDSGFGAGLLKSHGELLPAAHEPVITDTTWQAYQVARDTRRQHRRTEHATYLLTGLGVMHCVHTMPDGSPCGAAFGGGHFGHDGRYACYRCAAATNRAKHPGGYVLMSLVDGAVRAWVEQLATNKTQSADAEALAAAKAARRKIDAEKLDREVLDLDRALAQLIADRATDPDIPATVWEQAKAELLRRRANLAQRARSARAEAIAGEPARLAAQLAADWDDLSLEHLRAGLRGLLGRVDIIPGRPRATVTIAGRWQTGEDR